MLVLYYLVMASIVCFSTRPYIHYLIADDPLPNLDPDLSRRSV